jgi:hypothetical protein
MRWKDWLVMAAAVGCSVMVVTMVIIVKRKCIDAVGFFGQQLDNKGSKGTDIRPNGRSHFGSKCLKSNSFL